MNNIVNELLKEYQFDTVSNIRYPFAEVMQKIILSCLNKLGFYKEAVFHGGTCLRIFYELNRFSEDLDFSVINPNKDFSLTKYINPLIDQLKIFGLDFEANKIDNEANVKKCTLSINLYDLVKEYAGEKYLSGLRDSQKLKIKFEVDTKPPKFDQSDIEEVFILSPLFSVVSVFKLSTLFAGKLNAILTRPIDKTGSKGRDYYDYLFYISKHINPNLKYLQSSLSQFKIWNKNKEFKVQYLKDLLTNNFKNMDINYLKRDIEPLIKSKDELNIWSINLFLSTLKEIK